MTRILVAGCYYAKKDADKYKKLTDLTGLKVAAQQGSIQQQYTEDQIPDAKLQPFQVLMMVLPY